MRRILLCLGFVSCFLPLSAFAGSANFDVKAQIYSSTSCRYGGYADGNFKIEFNSQDVRWGSQVNLIYGFHETYRNQDWQFESSAPMMAVAPYTWAVDITRQVASRSSYSLESIQFVFEIVDAAGNKRYEKGSATNWGFYEGSVRGLRTNCKFDSNSYLELEVNAVERN